MKNRTYPSAKSQITCAVELHDPVKIPFDALKDKFMRFSEQNDIDLSNVDITETKIKGTFTNTAGVTHDINFMANGSQKSYLDGEIYKKMDGQADVSVERSVDKLIKALLQDDCPHSPFKRYENETSAPS